MDRRRRRSCSKTSASGCERPRHDRRRTQSRIQRPEHRVKLGTRNIGGAKQALDRAIEYARQRQQFGRAIATFGMIRQKLAEMAIRCFVGDAMVYRTLGDTDHALENVPPDDAAAVLTTIESFAVECSINKVWTSEALAYVADEALQVYGGYGYSRSTHAPIATPASCACTRARTRSTA